MKKILAVLLACCVSAAAFAEFRWLVDTTVATNIYGIIIPTGMHAQPYITDPVTGDRMTNNGFDDAMNQLIGLVPRKSTMLFTPSHYGATNYRNNGAYIPVSQSFFRPTITPGGFTWTEGNGFGVTMLWNANNIEAFVKFDGGELMNYFVYAIHGTPYTLGSFLESIKIPEYWVRANTRLFDAHFGNRGGGGRTDIFQDHTDWIPTPIRVDGFGVNVPSPEGPISKTEGHRNLNNIGANDFLFALRQDSWSGFDVSSYVVATFKMQQMIPDIPFPLFIDMSLDFDYNVLFTPQYDMNNQLNYPTGNADLNPANQGFGQSRVGGGLRISAVDVANIFTVDLAYKLRGGDLTQKINETWDEDLQTGDYGPDGVGSFSHVIGAYFNLPKLVPDLGIGFGYTALFRYVEDKVIGAPDDPDRYTVETKSPLFSGIDLFLRYTGVQDLRLTFKTNVSFANVPAAVWNENDDVIVRRIGLNGALINTSPYESQEWFAMYNSLAARLLITGRLNFNLELISHLGVITDHNTYENRTGTASMAGLNSWGTRKRTKHSMSASIYAVHQYSAAINMQAGISVYNEQSFTTLSGFPDGELGDFAPTKFHAGGVGISIPLKLIIRY